MREMYGRKWKRWDYNVVIIPPEHRAHSFWISSLNANSLINEKVRQIYDVVTVITA